MKIPRYAIFIVLLFLVCFCFISCDKTENKTSTPATSSVTKEKNTPESKNAQTEEQEKTEPDDDKSDETETENKPEESSSATASTEKASETTAEKHKETDKPQTVAPQTPTVQPEPKNTVKILSGTTKIPSTQYITNIDLRKTVVDYMYKMANIEWTCTENLSPKSPNPSYKKGTTYLGMPYYNSNVVRYDYFYSMLTSGKSIKDMGNTCSTSILEAWQNVSPVCSYSYTADMMPGKSKGTIGVGNIDWSIYDGENTINSVLKKTNINTVYDSYAKTQPGDAFMRHPNHAMLVTGKTVVVKNTDGTINPSKSYCVLTHQNTPILTKRSYPSSWDVDFKMYFSKIYSEGYLPVTLPELVENKTVKPYFVLQYEPETENLFTTGEFRASFKSNYCINTLKVELHENNASGKLKNFVTLYPCSKTASIYSTVKGFNIQSLPAGKYYLRATAANAISTESVLEVEIEIK